MPPALGVQYSFNCDPIATYAASNPGGIAVIDLQSGKQWSYVELHRAVDRLAAWLAHEFGENSAVRVATLAKNCAEMLILQLAGTRAGTIFVPLNWRLAGAEIDAPVVLAVEGLASKLQGVVARQSSSTTSIKFNLSEDQRKAIFGLLQDRRAA